MSPPTAPFGAKSDTWDPFYTDIARLKISNESNNNYQDKGLLGPPILQNLDSAMKNHNFEICSWQLNQVIKVPLFWLPRNWFYLNLDGNRIIHNLLFTVVPSTSSETRSCVKASMLFSMGKGTSKPSKPPATSHPSQAYNLLLQIETKHNFITQN